MAISTKFCSQKDKREQDYDEWYDMMYYIVNNIEQ